MADAPKYRWQQSRGEALYVDEATNRIVGYVFWKEDNRLNIEAHYCGPIPDGPQVHQMALGRFANEQAAKSAVEEYATQINEESPQKELVDPRAKDVAAKLTEGLEKQVVKK
jgi:hypothetical protein